MSLVTGAVILTVSVLTLGVLLRPNGHQNAAGEAVAAHASTWSIAPGAAASSVAISQRTPSLDTRAIQKQLQADTDGLQGTYGIEVIDLTTGATYGTNPGASFRAASVNKMPILVALYQRAAQGSLNLDRTLTLSEDEIQHYGTGTIQNAGAPRTYTLRELGALMIELSDNTAAYVLEHYLGQDAIQASLKDWGFSHTSMAQNTTTPAEAATFFSSLYSDRFLSASTTGVLLSLLQHTVFTDRLQSGVPSGVDVAHKIGTDTGVYNDAGIVFAADRPYAVAVLSQDADETEATRAFARISRDIYAFQSALPPVRTR